MPYKNYIPVAHWKAEAQESGLEWADVRARYHDIRECHRAYTEGVFAVRREAFGRCGVKKNHPAFWRGDVDHSAIERFDEVAADLAQSYPWLASGGGAAQTLFELLQKNDADFDLSDNDAWRHALAWAAQERESCVPENELCAAEF